jgi:ADP-dependent phosphofructokinase/glucokinase
MKDVWREKYNEIVKKSPELNSSVLTGFNANIDNVVQFEELELDLEGVTSEGEIEEVESIKDVRKILKHCLETGKNREVKAGSLDHSFEGEKSIGGQAGIIANFLSSLNASVTFYTPFLSEELANQINDKVLHPVYEDEFLLKNVRDAPNADRTKENIIIEFNEDKSGRLILSDKLRGFGPYFRSGIEENLELIDQDIDKAILSGFHNADGNFKPKLDKSKEQLQNIESPIHLEVAECGKEKYQYILHHITEEVQSIGLDESESLSALELFDRETGDDLSINEAFELGKLFIDRSEIKRVHIHTYRFHILVAEKNYRLSLEDMRDSLLFGEACGITGADIGKIPEKEDFKEEIDFENIHVKNLDQLEEFEQEHQLENFAERGVSMVKDYKVAAIPPLIHEEPKRLVGLGDLISSGAFLYDSLE